MSNFIGKTFVFRVS